MLEALSEDTDSDTFPRELFTPAKRGTGPLSPIALWTLVLVGTLRGITHGIVDVTGSVSEPVTVDKLSVTRRGSALAWKDAPASVVSEALADLDASGRKVLAD